MDICDVDEAVFEGLIKDFTDKHGDEALKDVYRFHRKLANKLDMKNFPAAEIYHRLLIKDINGGKYVNTSVREIAVSEKISEGTVYNIIKRACGIKRPIYQYTIKGKLIKKWQSAMAIEKELKYSAGIIRSGCRAGRVAYGYLWKYRELTGKDFLPDKN